MDNEPKKLEKRAWYRILKVLYGVGWMLVLVITLTTFLVVKPTGYVNTYNSSVKCSNGISYRLSNLEGVYKVGDKLSLKDEIFVKRICTRATYQIEEAKAAGYTDQEINKYLDQKQVSYALNLVENGSWRGTTFWTLVAFFIAAFLLDLFKKIVLYIVLGKKFSYWWLIKDELTRIDKSEPQPSNSLNYGQHKSQLTIKRVFELAGYVFLGVAILFVLMVILTIINT